MRTSGVVRWFDRSTGVGVVALDDGAECIVVRVHPGPAGPAEGGVTSECAATRSGRPDLVEALRAGTWGDGGRDY